MWSSTMESRRACESATRRFSLLSFLFFFNDTATTEIYTLSLHDALPILEYALTKSLDLKSPEINSYKKPGGPLVAFCRSSRSEEHTSELQSRLHLVCRLLLEKKKKLRHRHLRLVRPAE